MNQLLFYFYIIYSLLVVYKNILSGFRKAYQNILVEVVETWSRQIENLFVFCFACVRWNERFGCDHWSENDFAKVKSHTAKLSSILNIYFKSHFLRFTRMQVCCRTTIKQLKRLVRRKVGICNPLWTRPKIMTFISDFNCQIKLTSAIRPNCSTI